MPRRAAKRGQRAHLRVRPFTEQVLQALAAAVRNELEHEVSQRPKVKSSIIAEGFIFCKSLKQTALTVIS